jgi:copper(I)-binding protein
MEPMPFGLPMPHDSEVVVAPGGTHIMLTGLTGAAQPGDLLPVTMVFREAGSLDFEAPVFPLSAGETKVKRKVNLCANSDMCFGYWWRLQHLPPDLSS